MIIYNITYKVEWSVAKDWEEWMKALYVPEVLATGCFERHQFVRLLQVEQAEGPTYAVQYYTDALSGYNDYLLLHSSAFQKKLNDKWGEKLIYFSTLMEEVDRLGNE